MKQTLLIIPKEWFTTWILWSWLLVAAGWLVWHARLLGWGRAIREQGPILAIIAAIIGWVLPALSVPQVNPADPLGDLLPGGLAIRGYGFFLMLAIVSAMGLVVLRCRRLGQNPEPIITVCFVVIVSGLIGARLLYVIQKWPEFTGKHWLSTLLAIIDMSKGGLVVYGSLIGAIVGALLYLRKAKLPILATLDILAPAMAWGLAIGRIGCLMNGCCYGGLCGDDFPLGIEFPAGSPPYYEQYVDGSLLGIETKETTNPKFPREVIQVHPGSLGERFGLKAGDLIRIPHLLEPDRLRFILEANLSIPIPVVIETKERGDIFREIPASQFPQRSLKIHPTQIYATISAAIIFGLLWFFYPLRTFDGQVLALMLITYAVCRYLEEAIRVDEKGLMGTSLSISQWISIVGLGAGSVLWVAGQRWNSRKTS